MARIPLLPRWDDSLAKALPDILDQEEAAGSRSL
jgi:hypothetical protein